jgi:hypothetical protein
MRTPNSSTLKILQLRLRATISQMFAVSRRLRPAAQPDLNDVQKMRNLWSEQHQILTQIEALFENEEPAA